MRVLLFLPGGNREEGLRQLEHAARNGQMWAPQAQLELIQIYGWLEGRLDDALGKAEALHRRYPDNPELSFRLARLYAGPAVEAYGRAAGQFALILERAQSGHPHYTAATRYQALLGLAGARARLWRLQEAIAMLDPVLERDVADPVWVLPRGLLARGRYRALLNDPRAGEDARRVLAEAKWKDPWHAEARKQLDWIDERRQTGEAARFAELIPGNRLVAEERWELAEKYYQQVRRRAPDNWQARYRLAHLYFVRGQYEQAETEFNQVVNSEARRLPGWLHASSLLHLARIHDVCGEREKAIKLYRRIADDYDEEAEAALGARLGLVTPYKQVVLAAR